VQIQVLIILLTLDNLSGSKVLSGTSMSSPFGILNGTYFSGWTDRRAFNDWNISQAA
jgi:hypothetical protein